MWLKNYLVTLKINQILSLEVKYKTQELLDGVFNKGNFWGRQVLGDDDIFGNIKDNKYSIS